MDIPYPTVGLSRREGCAPCLYLRPPMLCRLRCRWLRSFSVLVQTSTRAGLGFRAGVKDYRLTYFMDDYKVIDTVDVRRYVLDDVDTQHHTNRNTVKQGAAFEYLPREICTHRAHGYVQAGILSVRTGLHGLTSIKVPKHGPVMGSWLVSGMLSQQLHGVTCILQARPFYPGPFYRPPGGLRYVWPLPVWDPDPPVWRPRGAQCPIHWRPSPAHLPRPGSG